MSAEISPQLVSMLNDPSSQDWVDVILELRPIAPESGENRAQAIANRRAGFQAVAESVKSAVQHFGGTVDGEAWINSTLKCHVPARALKKLGELRDIVRIDLPHALSRDG